MPKRKKNQTPFPIFLFVGGGIALIAAAFLLISRNNTTATVSPEPIAEEIPHPEIARVSIEEARSVLDSGEVIMLDVRSAEALRCSILLAQSTSPQRK